MRPIGEAIRWVVGTDDQAGAHDQCTVGQGLLHRLLTKHLERPIGFAGDFFHRFVFQPPQRRGLIYSDLAEIGVDRKR